MGLIIGTNGNNILIGGSGTDFIYGLGGNDTMFGGGGADYIHTGSGLNTVRAGGGDDVVLLEAAGGDLDGESGNDSLLLSFAAAASRFDLAAGTGRINGGVTFAAKNFENITTGRGMDLVYGSNGANRISTGAGNDTIAARGGADTIEAGAGDDAVLGDAGDDLLIAGTGRDHFDGGKDHDTLSYADSKGAIQVDVAAGTVKQAGDPTDTFANIELFLGSGRSDVFTGAAAKAEFQGNAGDDYFYAGSGAEGIHGGAGTDTVSYIRSGSGVGVNLTTGEGSGGFAQGDRLSGIEHISASNGSDQLTGDGKANILYGFAGDDDISGGGGDDILVGGAGRDELTGGAGADRFVFSAQDAGSVDTIYDFQRGVDTIDLWIDGDVHVAGDQDFTRLTSYAAPETQAGFTAGTINVRYDATFNRTMVDVNVDDTIRNGVDPAELTIALTGRVNLALSDFDF
ncbi:MAG: hypothetical protein DI556_14425 [Rhodovulum sulfidophilum]|uniref:Calcium-binding protein n=1 Tax=Rhodovulum sulfidophilum TaxID=35806 RepID=A0A2W5N4F0_RHOSU|nr:MAG: hypothetical protein DI556_14425 [Rhodovulum sulfidophilum]